MPGIRAGRRPNLRPVLWGGALGLLLLPAIAMQFTREVNWGAGDFVIAALLIISAGLGVEAALRLGASRKARWLMIGGVLALFVLIWAELAVGIFT